MHIVQDPFTYRVALNVQVFPSISIYTTTAPPLSRRRNSLRMAATQPQTGAEFEVGARFNFFKNRVTLGYRCVPHDRKECGGCRSNGVIDQAGEQHSKGIEADLRGRLSSVSTSSPTTALRTQLTMSSSHKTGMARSLRFEETCRASCPPYCAALDDIRLPKWFRCVPRRTVFG